MRKIVTAAFVTLDGVIQAPGGPEEDPTNGFRFGGWVPPYWDEEVGEGTSELFSAPFDLLLGRRTYDIFAAHWPFVELDPSASRFDELNAQIAERFNSITKYVATHRPETLEWQNSESLGENVVARLRDLKQEEGPALLTQGSSELVHLLLEHDLIDELHLSIFPLVLGHGKRLFSAASSPAAFTQKSSKVSPSGVLIASYVRSGEVQTGSFAMEEPTEAEIERRRNLA